jgi:hypothetical protein
MATAFLPPVDAMLPGHRLKLFDVPIQWIAAHGFEKFGGNSHRLNSIAGNIICQGKIGILPRLQHDFRAECRRWKLRNALIF